MFNPYDATIVGYYTLSNGAYTAQYTQTNNTYNTLRGAIQQSAGKLYVEFLLTAVPTASWPILGFTNIGFNPQGGYPGGAANSCGVGNGGNLVGSGFTSVYNVATTTKAGDVWAFAIDFTAQKIWVAINNVWQGSGNPAAGTGQTLTFVKATTGPLFPSMGNRFNGENVTIQTDAASQKYAPPSGFSAWEPPPVAGAGFSPADVATAGGYLSRSRLTVNVPLSTPNPWSIVRTVNAVNATTGKLYIEYLLILRSQGSQTSGLANAGFVPTNYLGSSNYSGGVSSNGNVGVSPGFAWGSYGAGSWPSAQGDVYGWAVDYSAGKAWLSVNNVWQGSGNPATGANPTLTFVQATVGTLFAALGLMSWGDLYNLQSTAATQKYAPPTGFVAWDAGAFLPPPPPPPPTRVFLTSASGVTWTVPQDWNNAHNSVECIGGGGGGQNATGVVGTGGEGGHYAKSVNLALTKGASINYNVAPAATVGQPGAVTWFGGTSFANCLCGAIGGAAGSASAANASTPTASNVGNSVVYAGGFGSGYGSNQYGGTGGGGAAGPGGPGGAGGSENSTGGGGGGGGGNTPGPAGAGQIGGTAGGNGGTAGDGTQGPGSGNGGNASTGGGGGSSSYPGGDGGRGAETTWASSIYGPGGGSGGGGGQGASTGVRAAGNASTYGGGGGGGGYASGRGGTGGPGLIVIQYWQPTKTTGSAALMVGV